MTTMPAPNAAKKVRDPRNGLRTSATLATVFTLLGHTVFGFEQSWVTVGVALVTGYASALLFEWVDAWACGGVPNFMGGGARKLVDFLLPAHMTSITLSFLLYTYTELWITAFTVALSLGAKHVLRVRQRGRLQHFMNPSNFGVAITFALFQWSSVLPWSFTTNLSGAADWIVPLVIVGLGTRLNLLFTSRLPTIAAWLISFTAIGAFRAWMLGSPWAAEMVTLTGIPMVLFTFYMITDPQTSPSAPKSQVLYGSSIAVAYAVLLALQVQYTMFYSVAVVCGLRGLYLGASNLWATFSEPETSAVGVLQSSTAA